MVYLQVFALTPVGEEPKVEDVSDLKADLYGELEQDLLSEARSLRNRLQQVEQELMTSQQEGLKLNRNYQGTVQTLADKTQELTKEVEQLKHQNETLLNEKIALLKGMEVAGTNTQQILELEKESLATINQIRDGGIQVS